MYFSSGKKTGPSLSKTCICFCHVNRPYPNNEAFHFHVFVFWFLKSQNLFFSPWNPPARPNSLMIRSWRWHVKPAHYVHWKARWRKKLSGSFNPAVRPHLPHQSWMSSTLLEQAHLSFWGFLCYIALYGYCLLGVRGVNRLLGPPEVPLSLNFIAQAQVLE